MCESSVVTSRAPELDLADGYFVTPVLEVSKVGSSVGLFRLHPDRLFLCLSLCLTLSERVRNSVRCARALLLL